MNRAILIQGLGYGDEGKGTTVDWLCREENVKLVVRYNGGAQAGHNVVDDAGRHHTFSQFGSGTFAGAATLLSRHMLVNPVTIVPEAKHLAELGVERPLSLIHVERDALVTTPYHTTANRLREMDRAGGRHGSCGMGIGETVNDWLTQRDGALHVRDMEDLTIASRKLGELRSRMIESTKHIRIETPEMRREADILEKKDVAHSILGYLAAFRANVQIVGPEWLLKQQGTIVFEGAQGVLLDQDFGFQPHTTWSDCTFGNAYRLLDWYGGDILRLGILRSYATRHGAGPFVTENKDFEACSKKDHNVWTDWQQTFRSGAFDLVAAKYALDVIVQPFLERIDGLVMTHLDSLKRAPNVSGVPVCTSYAFPLEVRRPAQYEHQVELTNRLRDARPSYETLPLEGYAESIAERLGVRLHATSWGATFKDKINHTRLQAA